MPFWDRPTHSVADREKPDGQERKPPRHQTMIRPAPQTKGRPGRPSRPMPDVLLPRRLASAASITPRGAFPQRTGCRSHLHFDPITAVSCRVQLRSSARRRSYFAPAGTVTAVIGAAAFKTAPVEAAGTAPASDELPFKGSAPSFVANERKEDRQNTKTPADRKGRQGLISRAGLHPT